MFLAVFGVLPSLYAIYLAFTKRNAFVGIDNFTKVFKDYRFIPAVEHVGLYLVVWLVALVLLVVVLAIIIHAIRCPMALGRPCGSSTTSPARWPVRRR